MEEPKLAMCNYEADAAKIREMALQHGFCGVDWTFKLEDVPESRCEQSRLAAEIHRLQPLEVRYHCAFRELDPGDVDPARSAAAIRTLRRVCELVSRLEGRYMTIHLGLGRDSTAALSWDRTIEEMAALVDYAGELGIRLCLENLAWGWSSRPELFERLIRKSGAGVTLDVGHARVCPSVESRYYAIEDFVSPHPEKVCNAHVYYEERQDRHVAPSSVEQMREPLDMLRTLPCDWWVLELRNEEALLSTLRVVRDYFADAAQRLAA